MFYSHYQYYLKYHCIPKSEERGHGLSLLGKKVFELFYFFFNHSYALGNHIEEAKLFYQSNQH